MDKKEAQVLFKEADRLFRSGNYLEALQHLAEIKESFPEDFNVLFPILLCREKLGRFNEALELCNQMMGKFDEPKHRNKLCTAYQRILQHTEAAEASSDTSGALPGNEFIKDAPYVMEVNPSGIIEVGGVWITWRHILVGVTVLAAALAVIIAVPLLLPKDDDGVVAGANIILLAGVILFQYIFNCIIFYLALWTTNNLLHEDIYMDIIDVCIFTPVFLLLASIPFIGWLIAYYVLASRYGMSLMDLIIFVVLLAIFNAAFFYMFMPGLLSGAATAGL